MLRHSLRHDNHVFLHVLNNNNIYNEPTCLTNHIDKIKFVIVDFEFTMINRKDLLLVSGSISNSLDKYKPVKLEGKPIVLTTTNKLKMLQNREVKKVMQSVGRIFRNEPELLLPLLGQLEASLKLKRGTTQSTTYINQYLHTDNRIPVIVFWNGTTDKEILQKLGLNRKMLNITSYNDNNDNYFNLKLLDISGSTSKLLYSSRIGYQGKNGRILNLMETHDLVWFVQLIIT
ncbi:hypothetical protein AGLY_001774 [Aphis glycines]|uniref:Uncharacterized protein n=1 Tax=Aphis glycines TaxID=307491 RepID=A0A6G0U4P5_APHGL|nr:hypothetical protein AGLY_001774 [Aphis glycines]